MAAKLRADLKSVAPKTGAAESPSCDAAAKADLGSIRARGMSARRYERMCAGEDALPSKTNFFGRTIAAISQATNPPKDDPPIVVAVDSDGVVSTTWRANWAMSPAGR
jgi:hypothetical protein